MTVIYICCEKLGRSQMFACMAAGTFRDVLPSNTETVFVETLLVLFRAKADHTHAPKGHVTAPSLALSAC